MPTSPASVPIFPNPPHLRPTLSFLAASRDAAGRGTQLLRTVLQCNSTPFIPHLSIHNPVQLLEKRLAEAHNLSAQCDGGRRLIMATAGPSSPTPEAPSLSTRASPSGGGAAEPTTTAEAGEALSLAEPPSTSDAEGVKAHPTPSQIPHAPIKALSEEGHTVPPEGAEGWTSSGAAAAVSASAAAAVSAASAAAAAAAVAAASAAPAAVSGAHMKPTKGPTGGDSAASAASAVSAIRGGFALALDIAAGLLFPGLLVAGAGAYGGVSGAG